MPVEVRIRSISYEAPGIHSYELAPVDTEELPPFAAGAHIDVRLPNGLTRQYSLHNSSRERHRYVISVLRLAGGRGGSDTIHDSLRVGQLLTISEPKNQFPLLEGAGRYVLVAGGIGITPLLAMASRLDELDANYVLHYCCRSRKQAAFVSSLASREAAGRVRIHSDGGTPAQGLNVEQLFEVSADGTQVYCCGPAGLMSAVREATAHWPAGTVHFESFSPVIVPQRAPSDPVRDEIDFEVELRSTGKVVPVQKGQSILEALRNSGTDVESSCEAGTCGTCRTRYLSGSPDHQDFVLAADEQEEFLMVCVSRSKSPRLVLDL